MHFCWENNPTRQFYFINSIFLAPSKSGNLLPNDINSIIQAVKKQNGGLPGAIESNSVEKILKLVTDVRDQQDSQVGENLMELTKSNSRQNSLY